MSDKKSAGTEDFNSRTFDGHSLIETEAKIIKEIPLEIFLNDKPVATIACTGNHVDELAVGFLRSEGFISGSEDIERIHIAGDTNSIYIYARPTLNPLACERKDSAVIAFSGARGTKSLRDRVFKKMQDDSLIISSQKVFFLMERLLSLAWLHDTTGGTHCSALADSKDVIVSREDIGRHNTIDMIGGYALLNSIDCSDKVIVRTGRVSSEIVCKVWNLGIPLMISISVPTSLAVELAEEAGMTLIGAVRGGRMNIYSHSKRVI
jgi:FdhD protein